MERHILRHIQEKIKEAISKIRALQGKVSHLESDESATLSRALIGELKLIRNDIFALNSEFRKLLSTEKTHGTLFHLLYNTGYHLEIIHRSLNYFVTRGIPNQTKGGVAIKQIFDSSSSAVSELEKLHTFIDLDIEKNNIQLIKGWIVRIKSFVSAIRQDASQTMAIYKQFSNPNRGQDAVKWLTKLDRFRLEFVEPLKDKFDKLFSKKLSGELGEYVQIIREKIIAIEDIYQNALVIMYKDCKNNMTSKSPKI